MTVEQTPATSAPDLGVFTYDDIAIAYQVAPRTGQISEQGLRFTWDRLLDVPGVPMHELPGNTQSLTVNVATVVRYLKRTYKALGLSYGDPLGNTARSRYANAPINIPMMSTTPLGTWKVAVAQRHRRLELPQPDFATDAAMFDLADLEQANPPLAPDKRQTHSGLAVRTFAGLVQLGHGSLNVDGTPSKLPSLTTDFSVDAIDTFLRGVESDLGSPLEQTDRKLLSAYTHRRLACGLGGGALKLCKTVVRNKLHERTAQSA